jgi:PIN domain nuclease of toxin-antitoxin system
MLITHLNGGEATSPIATRIINDFVRSGRNYGLVSMVTVMEVLVRPLQVGAGQGQHSLTFLTRTPHLQPVEIDIHVAHQAAMLRAFFKLKPADALTIGTGLVHQVGHLVANDRKWTKIPELHIPVRYLEDYVE